MGAGTFFHLLLLPVKTAWLLGALSIHLFYQLRIPLKKPDSWLLGDVFKSFYLLPLNSFNGSPKLIFIMCFVADISWFSDKYGCRGYTIKRRVQVLAIFVEYCFGDLWSPTEGLFSIENSDLLKLWDDERVWKLWNNLNENNMHISFIGSYVIWKRCFPLQRAW